MTAHSKELVGSLTRRRRRMADRIVLVVVAVVLLLELFPQPLFAHQYRRGAYTVYSTRPIPAGIDRILDAADTQVRRSDLYDSRMRHRIFLCNDFRLLRLFAPTSRGAFATTLLTGNIFIAKPDVESDTARRDAAEYPERPLTGVLAHEVTHRLIHGRLGFWRSLLQRPPEWKAEGICDWVAGGGSVPEAEGLRRMMEGQRDRSGPFAYFRYRKMVEYLTRVRSMTAGEILAAPLDPRQVERETVAWLRNP